MVITGGCFCGAVRYEVKAAPSTVTGELRDFKSTADSGARMHRRFCPVCGTHLFSDAELRPHLTFVRAGTLADPEIARPEITIWTSQGPSWACIAEDIPSLSRQAPPAA